VKALLTGANGFIGSHVLDALLALGVSVRALLRTTSDTRLIADALPDVEVVQGDLASRESLACAVKGVELVVHCAAVTKALRRRDYYATNATGVLNLVDACNQSARSVRHITFLSSLAVSGPGTPARPATEGGRPRPVSHYGRSKALGEAWLRSRSCVPFTILRPSAVYGPRDRDFLLVFKAIRCGLMPLVDGGAQWLSLVYVGDLVQAVLAVMDSREARGRTYHVAHPRPWTQYAFMAQVARTMSARPLKIPVPHPLLYPAFALRGVLDRLSGRPSIVNVHKVPEYAAPGWVCSSGAIAGEVGFIPAVPLEVGLRRTHAWYLQNGWLAAA
jgi:nucleoside-diphosphate-sugar epimerase